MIDMPLGASLKELMRQLALLIGKADQTSSGDELPDDTGERAILKHWLNQGYALFMRSDPRWSFLKRKVVLTLSSTAGAENVNGETWRVRLPAFVRGFPSPAEFITQQNDLAIGTLCMRSSEWIDRAIALDGSGTTGVPMYFSCRPIPIAARTGAHGLGQGAADDWEAVFYPRPSRSYSVAATFPVRWTELVDDEDRTICGPEHDQAVVFAAEYLWASRDSEMRDRRDECKARWLEALGLSMQLDWDKRPPTTGNKPRRPRAIERVTWTVGDNAKQITP